VIEQIDVTEGEAGVIDGKQGHWRWGAAVGCSSEQGWRF
jgi:hypothetical protein